MTPIIGAMITSYFGAWSRNPTLSYTLPVVFLIVFASTCASLLFFFFEESSHKLRVSSGYTQIMEEDDSDKSLDFDSPKVSKHLEMTTMQAENSPPIGRLPEMKVRHSSIVYF